MNLTFNKTLGGLIIVVSIAVFFARRNSYLSSWTNVDAELVNVKKINNLEKIEINYKFKTDKDVYVDKLITDLEKYKYLLDDNKQKTIQLYYHKENPELVILHLPHAYDDMLILALCVVLGLYLYYYACACEECT